MPKLRRIVIPLVLLGLLAATALASKVSIDADGVLAIDSRKVFSIGLNLGPPLGSVAPESSLAVKASQLKGGNALGLEFCVRQSYNSVYVLACKREGPEYQVQFTGLPQSIVEGEVMFESPRTVRADRGAFTDWFGPFEVHVYRFRLLDRQ